MNTRYGVLGAVLLMLMGTDARAEIRGIHLSYSSPDTTNGITVTWLSDSVSDPTTVSYGMASTDEHVALGTVIEGNSGLGAIHSVSLTDLQPGTKYVYKVGGSSGWSEEASFRTSPSAPCQPLRFIAFGDNRPDTDYLPQFHWNPILVEATMRNPLFLVHTGDIVKDGGSTDQWNTFLESSGFDLARHPLMACIGNHDDGPGTGDSANYNQLFSYPRNTATSTEDFYYFVTADAIFVSLSTQTFTDGANPMQMQADWLDTVLTENPRPWKFVFLHHPNYTSHKKYDLIFTEFEFNHPPNEIGQNAALVPVFDKHHVDMVFAGHNHYYERFKPLRGGAGNPDGNLADGFADGTVYVIAGGAGALTYDEFELFGIEIDLISWVCKSATGSEVCSGKHHYAIVDINGSTLNYEVWSTAEQNFGNDPNNVELIDSFTIVKDVGDFCDEPTVVEPDPVEPPAGDVVTVDGNQETVTSEPEADSATNADSQTTDGHSGQDSAGSKDGSTGKPQVDVSVSVDVLEAPDVHTDQPGKSEKSGGCDSSHVPSSGLLPLALAAIVFYLLGWRRRLFR